MHGRYPRPISCNKVICVGLKTTGSAVVWGFPRHVSISHTVDLTRNIRDVSCGTEQCLAVKTDGSVVAWGTPFSKGHVFPARHLDGSLPDKQVNQQCRLDYDRLIFYFTQKIK